MDEKLEKAFNEIHELESAYFMKHYDMHHFNLIHTKIVEILSGLAEPAMPKIAEDIEDGSLFIYENKELINIKFLPKERFEKLISALHKLVIAYTVLTQPRD